MESYDIAAGLAAKLTELLCYSTAAESILGILPIIDLSKTQVKRLVNLDEEIAPELDAATAHLNEASEALRRAFKFASARMSVRMELENQDPE